jgi:predicted transcriptional regulator of viral defense system
MYHYRGMNSPSSSQRERALRLLASQGMTRLAEFRRAGITGATVSRLERDGAVLRLGRGLYQLPNAPADAHHTLAQAAKMVTKGIVVLASALAFHDLTDRQPPKVWVAIGPKDWRPRVTVPDIRVVRYSPARLMSDIETHVIEGVPVRITNPARTITDLFRYRRTVGDALPVKGLKEALRLRKATPAEISRLAIEAKIWPTVRPYLEALTAHA